MLLRPNASPDPPHMRLRQPASDARSERTSPRPCDKSAHIRDTHRRACGTVQVSRGSSRTPTVSGWQLSNSAPSPSRRLRTRRAKMKPDAPCRRVRRALRLQFAHCAITAWTRRNRAPTRIDTSSTETPGYHMSLQSVNVPPPPARPLTSVHVTLLPPTLKPPCMASDRSP